MVSARFDHSLSIMNSTHPLVREIEKIGVKDLELANRIYADLRYPSSNIGRAAATLAAAAERHDMEDLRDLALRLQDRSSADGYSQTIHLSPEAGKPPAN